MHKFEEAHILCRAVMQNFSTPNLSCILVSLFQISSNEPKDETPFSFLGALEEGYFSDLTIKDDKGTEVKSSTFLTPSDSDKRILKQDFTTVCGN